MEFAAVTWAPALTFVGFEVLALDSAVAGAAQRSVQLVVMLGAVRAVFDDIEIRRLERNTAVTAGKTFPVDKHER